MYDVHICVADNPQVRSVTKQNKDGCDKSKVRNALLNCAHHIYFFLYLAGGGKRGLNFLSTCVFLLSNVINILDDCF